jgi:hypothetical protein
MVLNRKRRCANAELVTAIVDYVENLCNTMRRHSSLGYVTPNEFEALHSLVNDHLWIRGGTQPPRLGCRSVATVGANFDTLAGGQGTRLFVQADNVRSVSHLRWARLDRGFDGFIGSPAASPI